MSNKMQYTQFKKHDQITVPYYKMSDTRHYDDGTTSRMLDQYIAGYKYWLKEQKICDNNLHNKKGCPIDPSKSADSTRYHAYLNYVQKRQSHVCHWLN